MSVRAHIKLARTLPPRLTEFFRRYPPGTHSEPSLNPFQPTKNPLTGRWQNPIYSLRRQADMVKLAKQYNVDSLLPPTVKSDVAKEAKFLAGKQMKRVHRPKGHKYEKVVHQRVDMRKEAMLRMPELIKEWRLARNGRFWKKWPRITKK